MASPFDYYLNGVAKYRGNEMSRDPIAVPWRWTHLRFCLNESGKNVHCGAKQGKTVEKGKDSKKYKATLIDFEKWLMWLLVKSEQGLQEVISQECKERCSSAYAADRTYKDPPKFEGMAFKAIKDINDWRCTYTFDSKSPRLVYVLFYYRYILW